MNKIREILEKCADKDETAWSYEKGKYEKCVFRHDFDKLEKELRDYMVYNREESRLNSIDRIVATHKDHVILEITNVDKIKKIVEEL